MSYDLEVYLVNKPELVEGIESKNWLISVHDICCVEEEDIPVDVRRQLPGIKFLQRVTIEGLAPDSAYKKALALVKKIAKSYRGVIVDQQQGLIETPRGLKRIQVGSFCKEDSGKQFEVSIFFNNLDVITPNNLDKIVNILSGSMCEALPRRYGLIEPPEYKLENQGIEHFLEFLKQYYKDSIVWCCSKPFSYIFLSVPEQIGPTNMGYRCAKLSIIGSCSALSDDGFCLELIRVWKKLSILLSSFYSEIREGECPIKSWWWNGIPATSPICCLISEPYINLWPEFKEYANTNEIGQLFSISNDRNTLVNLWNTLPSTISQPSQIRREFDPETGELWSESIISDLLYPTKWPFDGPRS